MRLHIQICPLSSLNVGPYVRYVIHIHSDLGLDLCLEGKAFVSVEGWISTSVSCSLASVLASSGPLISGLVNIPRQYDMRQYDMQEMNWYKRFL